MPRTWFLLVCLLLGASCFIKPPRVSYVARQQLDSQRRRCEELLADPNAKALGDCLHEARSIYLRHKVADGYDIANPVADKAAASGDCSLVDQAASYFKNRGEDTNDEASRERAAAVWADNAIACPWPHYSFMPRVAEIWGKRDECAHTLPIVKRLWPRWPAGRRSLLLALDGCSDPMSFRRHALTVAAPREISEFLSWKRSVDARFAQAEAQRAQAAPAAGAGATSGGGYDCEMACSSRAEQCRGSCPVDPAGRQGNEMLCKARCESQLGDCSSRCTPACESVCSSAQTRCAQACGQIADPSLSSSCSARCEQSRDSCQGRCRR